MEKEKGGFGEGKESSSSLLSSVTKCQSCLQGQFTHVGASILSVILGGLLSFSSALRSGGIEKSENSPFILHLPSDGDQMESCWGLAYPSTTHAAFFSGEGGSERLLGIILPMCGQSLGDTEEDGAEMCWESQPAVHLGACWLSWCL